MALVLSKALDYTNVLNLFTEDVQNPIVAKQSLHLLEMVILMLEQWVQTIEVGGVDDDFMLGLVISLLEVLVHTPAFWARLKQSEILTSIVIKVQDAERDPSSMLKKKSVAVMKAIACERHSALPDPVDLHRYRSKNPTTGREAYGELKNLPY